MSLLTKITFISKIDSGNACCYSGWDIFNFRFIFENKSLFMNSFPFVSHGCKGLSYWDRNRIVGVWEECLDTRETDREIEIMKEKIHTCLVFLL